jgi:hypothetical protein
MADDTVMPGTETVSAGAETGLDFDISTEETQVETPTETTEAPQDDQQRPLEGDKTQDRVQDDPETQDFRGHVSNRIRNLVKLSPELGKALTNPKVRDAIEAPLRREAAYRDVFPTVAEAKAMRERFPNGLQDVQALEDDVKEIEGIDNLTYNRDQEGNYSGHPELINNIFSSDKDAAISLFKTLPKEWARLDRDSYNDVMGKIVGATLTGTGSWEQLIELREHAANTEGLKGIIPQLDKILNRLAPFVEERRPDPQQEKFNQERQQWNRQRQQSQEQDNKQFNNNFVQESTKIQREIIGQHRLMQKLATVKSVTPQKRAEITEKIRVKVEQFLSHSPAFMRKITESYKARNMEESSKIQRQFWGQEWLLNRMIRDVLKVETPNLVNQNRTTVQNRTGVKPPVKATTDNGKGEPTGPYQVNNQWYHKDGRRMTTVEAMKQSMSLS